MLDHAEVGQVLETMNVLRETEDNVLGESLSLEMVLIRDDSGTTVARITHDDGVFQLETA